MERLRKIHFIHLYLTIQTFAIPFNIYELKSILYTELKNILYNLAVTCSRYFLLCTTVVEPPPIHIYRQGNYITALPHGQIHLTDLLLVVVWLTPQGMCLSGPTSSSYSLLG